MTNKIPNKWSLLLLIIPFIALLWVPFYNQLQPYWIEIPFFYWYQLFWILLSGVILGLVYILTNKAQDAE